MATIYETITDRIISTLESGVIPWKREWKTSGKSTGLPYNLVSGKPYRGINIVSLLCSGYSSNGWCTYKQAQELGYQVRKGEKGSPIVYWQFPDKKNAAESDAKTYAPFARPYWVFNVAQLDGVPAELPLDAGSTFDPIAECESVVNAFMASGSHPTLAHGGDRAFFSQSRDYVQMPPRESFLSAGGYYATLFHEFAHSTGIKSRCDRAELQAITTFGDEDYSREELVAEFAAAFLCAETGCSNEERITNSVAYIQGWLSSLKHDKTLAMQAAQRAQRAAEFILLRSFAAAADEAAEVAA
jgi:antirestriction protein ArdC